MKNKHTQSQNIREFILQQVPENPRGIARLVQQKFDISRQAVNRHLSKLVEEGILSASGTTRNKEYRMKPLKSEAFVLTITQDLEEDSVWRRRIRPLLENVSSNVVEICHYGFTEILNNVLDHSTANTVKIGFEQTAIKLRLAVADNGVGIFAKIQQELGLENHLHAVLELAKGKLTTDPERHTGEGIFFTSRMFDDFYIISGTLRFAHLNAKEDWLIEAPETETKGTEVIMEIDPQSTRTVNQVFEKFASEKEDYGFTRTKVPVALAQYGDENLISRSQAKRLVARFDRFKEVILDFKGVNNIGPAFADEIFRVFQAQHPETQLAWINANQNVERMIKRALKNI
ncbi:DUF4325 domain-containing protein [candidate division KSB1 bacterium]|nr:DUF4325 domain-containing protein [candidate division KSB1 bacterium]NIR71758.1 DUF4325 domain-containing protein [candidate division KSB1 bacterium]NIS24914.1 DUF4325 domain-containing protein [candidate division KSB1 bacterium]NIT71790.1 DUF4325 domain-containing protein [candidate division KSB1 bacterium]NIU25528.1 DUF4325 domain-containing protein [candidate division KSB1 bacterium]